MFQRDLTVPPGTGAGEENEGSSQQGTAGAPQADGTGADKGITPAEQPQYSGQQGESEDPEGDASPERIARYDLDLDDLRRELRGYVKPSPKAKVKRTALPAAPAAPRARAPLEGPCDALVIFIHPELCACGAVHRSHFIGLRRPLRGGGHAYCAITPDLAHVALGLPTLLRYQRETNIPLCSVCCADVPQEHNDAGRIEVNHLSRVETHDDFETFTQPARQLKAEETPDEPSNDQ